MDLLTQQVLPSIKKATKFTKEIIHLNNLHSKKELAMAKERNLFKEKDDIYLYLRRYIYKEALPHPYRLIYFAEVF